MVSYANSGKRDRKFIVHKILFKNNPTKYTLALPHGTKRGRQNVEIRIDKQVVMKYVNISDLKQPMKWLAAQLR